MKNQKKFQKRKTIPPRNNVQPFIVHVRELRRRILYVVLTIIAFGALAYIIQDHIVNALLRPAMDQQFIYTTAGGGFNFLVSICIYFGLAASVPLIMYHLFCFLEPLFQRHSRRFILRCGLFSTILAVLGGLFGYYVGLPAALRFLLHQFRTDQIQPLLTIQEYVSFVMIYILGFALLFQIPLILLFINRITHLRPRRLLGYQRFVVTGAFVLAAIITPSGDMVNQLIMAGPIIAMYQFGVAGVWFYNFLTKRDCISALRAQDAIVQSTRRSLTGANLLHEPDEANRNITHKAPLPVLPATPPSNWFGDNQTVKPSRVYFDDVRRVTG